MRRAAGHRADRSSRSRCCGGWSKRRSCVSTATRRGSARRSAPHCAPCRCCARRIACAWCKLPMGLDPDDLVKRDGAQAMERLLGDARGLLDMLWEHEREAAPLHSPEDKAGLKARLMAHVDTIADPDIKAMYRREWLDRFSDFAFPRRESTTFTPRAGTGRKFAPGRFRELPPARPLPETSRAWRTQQHDGQRALICAVVAGLIRWPGEIARHAEALAPLAEVDARYVGAARSFRCPWRA